MTLLVEELMEDETCTKSHFVVTNCMPEKIGLIYNNLLYPNQRSCSFLAHPMHDFDTLASNSKSGVFILQ